MHTTHELTHAAHAAAPRCINQSSMAFVLGGHQNVHRVIDKVHVSFCFVIFFFVPVLHLVADLSTFPSFLIAGFQ